jgi:hypothetical protein
MQASPLAGKPADPSMRFGQLELGAHRKAFVISDNPGTSTSATALSATA